MNNIHLICNAGCNTALLGVEQYNDGQPRGPCPHSCVSHFLISQNPEQGCADFLVYLIKSHLSWWLPAAIQESRAGPRSSSSPSSRASSDHGGRRTATCCHAQRTLCRLHVHASVIKRWGIGRVGVLSHKPSGLAKIGRSRVLDALGIQWGLGGGVK